MTATFEDSPFEDDPHATESDAVEAEPDWEDDAGSESDPGIFGGEDHEDYEEPPTRREVIAQKIADALAHKWGHVREYAKETWERSRQTSKWAKESRKARKAAFKVRKRGPWVDKNGKPTRPNVLERAQDLYRYNRTGYGEPLTPRRGGPGPDRPEGGDDEPYPDPDGFGGPEGPEDDDDGF